MPDATQMAQAGTTAQSSLDTFPILMVVLAFVVLVTFGPLVIRAITKSVPKR